MKLNPQKHKYDVLEITDVKKLRRYAKAYGYDGLPKNIKNVSYYGKILSNFIDDKQHGPDYYDKAGINVRLNSLQKEMKNRMKNSKAITEKVTDKMIRDRYKVLQQFARQMTDVKKGARGMDLNELGQVGSYIRRGFDNITNIINGTTTTNLLKPENLIEAIDNATKSDYIFNVIDMINSKNQFLSDSDVKEITNAFNKLSVAEKIRANNNYGNKFKLIYEFLKDVMDSPDERISSIKTALMESLGSSKDIKSNYGN